ncbi:MAG TPA: hypothetical protein PKY81_12310 [bacterium]|nr:hypothetical protein [bacterium]
MKKIFKRRISIKPNHFGLVILTAVRYYDVESYNKLYRASNFTCPLMKSMVNKKYENDPDKDWILMRFYTAGSRLLPYGYLKCNVLVY